MPTLNLQQLLSSDTIGDLVEKINQNFSQVATNGGGPQGSRGIQGPPGLPGLRGESGPAGDAGADAKQVTIVGDDPNWPGLYAGDAAGTTVATGADATAAITAGYNEGDIWIDNSGGVFYDIHENGAGTGIYVFVAHPISPATLAANDYWLDDTTFDNATGNLATEGLRLSHRFATLSLTSEQQSSDPLAPSTTASITEPTSFQSITGTYGYRRKAFKLSIDSLDSTSSNIRVTDLYNPAGAGELGFNISKDNFKPLIYLNSTGTEDSFNGFGILHNVTEDASTATADFLSISSDNSNSAIVLDTNKTFLTGERLSFVGSNNVSERKVSFNDYDRDQTQYTDSKFWFSISTQADSALLPFGSNEFDDNLGIRLRKTPAGNSAVSFYVQDGDSALSEANHHVMSILDNNVHITNRNSVQTNSSDILRAFKFAVESDDDIGQQERIAIFKGGYDGISFPSFPQSASEYLGIGIGDFKYMGTAPFPPPPSGSDKGPAIIYSLFGNTDAFPNSNWNRLLLQPRNEIFDSVNTGQPDNTGAYGVSIGTLFNSRFGVEGNFAIGESAYQLATAPDYGGIIQGQVGIGRTTVLGTVDLQVAGSISTDTGFIGWNTYFDTDFRRTAAGPLAWIKQEVTGSASQDYLGIYAGATGSAGSTATAGPIRRMSIRNQSGFVGIDTTTQAQKLTINKTATGNIEGLQIIDESSGMSGASAGLQFRLDGGNTGQIGFTSSVQATNDIEIFTAGEKRINIDGSTGRVLMHRNYTGSLSATAGTSTLEVKNGSETKSNVTAGTFRGDTIDTLDQRGGGYVGYNSSYNETSNVVTYNDRQGTLSFAPGAAGAMTFVDNVGGWHVAPYYISGIEEQEEERDPLIPTPPTEEPPITRNP